VAEKRKKHLRNFMIWDKMSNFASQKNGPAKLGFGKYNFETTTIKII